jgi:hypothetical protein
VLSRVLTALCCAGWLLVPAAAYACTRGIAEPFQLQASGDSEGPAPFRDVTALTHRVAATRCSDGVCTSNSCGDSGILELSFQAPSEALAGELGYRMMWLSGDWPKGLRAQLDQTLPLDAAADRVSVELGWRGVTELDGELVLVAVDRAGNESEPSAPVRVSWSGCTDFYEDPFCLAGGSESRTGASCAVAPTRRRMPLLAALSLGTVALIRIRRRTR